MKRVPFLILLILLPALALAGYQPGDVVTDFEFQDSNIGPTGDVEIYTHTIHGLIDSGRVIVIDFGGPW